MNDAGTPGRAPGSDPVTEAMSALHHSLPRQGPGSDATTRRPLPVAGSLPDGDGWDEHRAPLTRRLAPVDPHRPGMPEAPAAPRAESGMRREHGGDHRSTASTPTTPPRTEP
ncbi:hypothetical protein MHW47_10005 [Streptomyces sp. OfavH-34-F]|uniref:hypothetical protein n=1 Tax=Streptomyces sp. OfavH-34-F TaxID=2917760 RepID=UPI001EF28F9F|nr:hypothetical protein [Streptomyces sp. OfavH-34-F]MCG7524769.1 hypothetical protein [Streptomyces sp. OfavH-34-F]